MTNAVSENPIERGDHNHGPAPSRVSAQMAASRIVEVAKMTEVPPRRVVSDLMLGVTDEVIASLPTRDNLRRRIQRKRLHVDAFPPNPRDINFEIPPRFKTITINGLDQNFVLADTFDPDDDDLDGNRIILFATKEMMDLMVTSEHWMADGTFKIAPHFFFNFTSFTRF